MRYAATERKWVKQVLARLTPEERVEYERRMKAAPGHHASGKKYDGLKAEVAEAVMIEFRKRGTTLRGEGER